ncbi:uncharacterized protein B0H64DRAFT_349777 [Chaetomium fimeti]|uniref:RTA1 domain protein n=1 Tax=Chaetomium fimeti TaxID=1854472 RepID=A0AAE0H6P7_9PEZI|nr:hypothetical protein B0H64DRAFT_349777 [Chaetomium fimeti]
MSDGNPVPDSVYFYAPNKVPAILFAAAFGVTGLFHLWQCFYYTSWAPVTGFLPFFCALLTAGYATRGYGTDHYDDPQVYTASILLLYAAPPLLQLTNYLILTRVFHFVPYCAPMHPSRIIVASSAFAAVIELLTIAGMAYLTDRTAPDKSLGIGETLTRASLVLQVMVTGVFLLLAGFFYYKCREGRIRNARVARPLFVSCASILLVLGRTIYRTVEHFGVPASREGVDPMSLSPMVRYEWYFYVFDAAFILLATVLLNIAHPARYLPENPRLYLAQDGKTVLKGPGWNDSRSKTETIFNPFAMLKSDGPRQKKFWEQNGYHMRGVRRPGAGR